MFIIRLQWGLITETKVKVKKTSDLKIDKKNLNMKAIAFNA